MGPNRLQQQRLVPANIRTLMFVGGSEVEALAMFLDKTWGGGQGFEGRGQHFDLRHCLINYT